MHLMVHLTLKLCSAWSWPMRVGDLISREGYTCDPPLNRAIFGGYKQKIMYLKFEETLLINVG